MSSIRMWREPTGRVSVYWNKDAPHWTVQVSPPYPEGGILAVRVEPTRVTSHKNREAAIRAAKRHARRIERKEQ